MVRQGETDGDFSYFCWYNLYNQVRISQQVRELFGKINKSLMLSSCC